MSNSEKYWALKSSNLKRIANSGKKKIAVGSAPKNNLTQRSDGSNLNYNSTKDIRKSSYPVLPDLPHKNETGNPGLFPDWEIESNVSYGLENDISSTRAAPYPLIDTPTVIDNTSYRGLINPNKNTTNKYGKSYIQTVNPISNKYVLKQKSRASSTTSKPGINLHVFHAVQLITLDIIDETLEDEIVPDVLISVFKDIQYKEKLFRKQIVPIVLSTAEQIMVEVIDQYIQETVVITLLRDSKSQLRSQIILKWLWDEILPPILTITAEEAVKEVVEEKMAVRRSNNILENLINDFIFEEITTSENIIFKEAMLESTLNEYVIIPVVQETLSSTMKDMLNYYHEKVNRLNLQQVNEMAIQKPLGILIMDHLISVGIRQKMVYGPSLIGQQCFEHIVFNILLKKTFDIYDALMNTVENRSLRQWHQNINQSIATNILLKELIEHSDADLCDLDATEVTEPHIPRYLSDINEIFYSNSK